MRELPSFEISKAFNAVKITFPEVRNVSYHRELDNDLRFTDGNRTFIVCNVTSSAIIERAIKSFQNYFTTTYFDKIEIDPMAGWECINKDSQLYCFKHSETRYTYRVYRAGFNPTPKDISNDVWDNLVYWEEQTIDLKELTEEEYQLAVGEFLIDDSFSAQSKAEFYFLSVIEVD